MPALADLDLFASQEAEAAPPGVEPEPAVAEPAVAEPVVAEPAVADAAVAEPAAGGEIAEAAAEVQAEGAVPEAVDPAAVVDPGQTASEQAFGAKPAAQDIDLSRGTYSPEDYQAACTAAGTPEKWDDRYIAGHTDAAQWHQPYDHGYDMTFTLTRGHSASQAIKDFITGPTIADWRVIALALEIDDVRDTLGDHKFDALFGSALEGDDAQIPMAQRLQISVDLYTVPLADQMKALAEEKDEAQLHPEQPEAPAVAALVEDKPREGGVTQQPAPELVAEELGVEREREQDFV
jgi:hypothetical protein